MIDDDHLARFDVANILRVDQIKSAGFRGNHPGVAQTSQRQRSEAARITNREVLDVVEPLVDEVRPHCKVPHADLRRTIEAIFWRHQNGAKWRSVPSELGPWSRAAQTFIRWARLGVWERLLLLAQERGVEAGRRVRRAR